MCCLAVMFRGIPVDLAKVGVKRGAGPDLHFDPQNRGYVNPGLLWMVVARPEVRRYVMRLSCPMKIAGGFLAAFVTGSLYGSCWRHQRREGSR